jgi:hypothetical protein
MSNIIHMSDLSRRPRALFLRSPPQDPFRNSVSSGSRSSIPPCLFFLSLSAFFNSFLASVYPLRWPCTEKQSSIQRDFQNRSCFFTWMTPVCLRTFPLLSSDESPSDGQLAGLSFFSSDVPLGNFPSTKISFPGPATVTVCRGPMLPPGRIQLLPRNPVNMHTCTYPLKP